MLVDLLRHGQVQGGDCYRGSGIDDPLTPKGMKQMQYALPDELPWQRIVSSPMKRCCEFASWLATTHHIPLVIDNRFMEIGFGQWEGRLKSDLKLNHPGMIEQFYQDPVTNRPVNAEKISDLIARVGLGLAQIKQQSQSSEERVLLVGHAGVIRAALAYVLDIPANKIFRIRVSHASFTRIGWDRSGWHLHFHGKSQIHF